MKQLLAMACAAGIALAWAAPARADLKPVVVPPKPVHHHHHFGGSSNHWPVWVIMGCATGVVVAAVAVNASQNRQLTAGEAWTCGLGALFAQPVAPMAVPVRASY